MLARFPDLQHAVFVTGIPEVQRVTGAQPGQQRGIDRQPGHAGLVRARACGEQHPGRPRKMAEGVALHPQMPDGRTHLDRPGAQLVSGKIHIHGYLPAGVGLDPANVPDHA